MKPTVLGRVLGLVALSLFALAFVVGSVGPAVGAVALLAYVDATQRATRLGHVKAQRHVPPVAGVETLFPVSVEVTSDLGLPLRVDDPPAPGTTVVARHGGTGRGHAVLEQTVRAASPGRIAWQHVDVSSRDPWGLWEATVRVPAPGHTRIAPEGGHVEAGRRHGRRHTVQEAVKDPLAVEMRPEVRLVRPYMPADRSRDIDWRLTMRAGELMVRDRERSAPRRYIIMLDATRSMRRVARVPKLRTAVHVAAGLAGAAQGAGVSASLVAFHEEGVQVIGDATTRAALQQVVHALSRLPAPVEGFRLTTDLDRVPTPAEREFLRAIAPMSATPRATAPSLDQALSALGRVTPGSSFVIAIMDAEVNPRRAEVLVGRLQRMGHAVALVVPATGPHHFTRRDAPMDDLREAMRRREALQQQMAVRRVPMFVVRPGEEQDVVREVARRAV